VNSGTSRWQSESIDGTRGGGDGCRRDEFAVVAPAGGGKGSSLFCWDCFLVEQGREPGGRLSNQRPSRAAEQRERTGGRDQGGEGSGGEWGREGRGEGLSENRAFWP
jgi:hypothetical protein